MRRIDSPIAVIRSCVPSLDSLHILDIGCGDGGFAKQIAAEGASVAGIDPQAQVIAKAKITSPGIRFEVATAEALPFQDHAFDLAVMINSLHHVPVPLMGAALREARRVLRKDGSLIIVEPLSSGNFFDAMRRIEDETEVRREAQLALTRAEALFASHRTLGYVRRETFDTAEQFVARIVAVDPARQAVVDADRDAILAEVHHVALKTHDGALAFDQPIKADIFSGAR
ncbi:MAG: class I SAM-dependent methyltransferase [Hyphomicrobiales bacterium]